MRIAHCQFEPWVGDFEHNLARFDERLKRADTGGTKIVSFPERFFTGSQKRFRLNKAGHSAGGGVSFASVAFAAFSLGAQ